MPSPPLPSAPPTKRTIVLVASAAALHLLPLWQCEVNPPTNPAFALSAPATPDIGDAADFREELVDPALSTPSAHVASLCELPDGRLGAAWYGGTREGHQDVALFFSLRSKGEAGSWSPPQAVVTRDSATRELQRYVRKVGNAVVFADTRGALWLVYVSVAVGGWSGSSLNFKRSVDDGRTWTPSRRLTLSPFDNISELVKNKPATLAGGDWVLPIYHEAAGKFPELLWFREVPGVFSFAKTRLFGGATAFQPALVPLASNEALALCRPAGGSRAIMLSRSTDAGLHWSAPQSTGLPNPDSGVDALRLFDGRLLMAFNDSTKARDNLRLAISNDNGVSWTRAATIVAEPGGEFSYPFLLQSADGRVHLVYTWQRKGIKHVAFSLAWLNSRAALPPSP
jgi:predicted neuraminidase